MYNILVYFVRLNTILMRIYIGLRFLVDKNKYEYKHLLTFTIKISNIDININIFVYTLLLVLLAARSWWSRAAASQ